MDGVALAASFAPYSVFGGQKARSTMGTQADNWRRMTVYERVYALTRLVPAGQVTTYGQIADFIEGCTPRMVGYALFNLPAGSDVPWQRVINARGEVSPRPGDTGSGRQRALLTDEGVPFDAAGRTDLRRYRWPGPSPRWLAARGFLPA